MYLTVVKRANAFPPPILRDPYFALDSTWSEIDNFTFKKDIGFHKCNDTDRQLIYEPDQDWADFMDEMFPYYVSNLRVRVFLIIS